MDRISMGAEDEDTTRANKEKRVRIVVEDRPAVWSLQAGTMEDDGCMQLPYGSSSSIRYNRGKKGERGTFQSTFSLSPWKFSKSSLSSAVTMEGGSSSCFSLPPPPLRVASNALRFPLLLHVCVSA